MFPDVEKGELHTQFVFKEIHVMMFTTEFHFS